MAKIFSRYGYSVSAGILLGAGAIAVSVLSASPASAQPLCQPARIEYYNNNIDWWAERAFFWSEELYNDEASGADQATVDLDQSCLDNALLQRNKAEVELEDYQSHCM